MIKDRRDIRWACNRALGYIQHKRIDVSPYGDVLGNMDGRVERTGLSLRLGTIAMRGSVDIKVRPTRLALLVEPNNKSQTREAIRLACSLWGGMYFPIIQLHRNMPRCWRNPPIAAPKAKDVVNGYIDAFDPDFLVQFTDELPPYMSEIRTPAIKPQAIWERKKANGEVSYGLGIFDLLYDVYNTHFKYKAKYPVKVVIPSFPNRLGTFWASLFGEYEESLINEVMEMYGEALEIERTHASMDSIEALLDNAVLFPRRITTWGITHQSSLGFGRENCVFYMDASKIEDVIDFWNLRATGRYVLPMPKQFAADPVFTSLIEEFVRSSHHALAENPKIFDTATFIRSRNSTMEEMAAHAKSLNLVARNAGSDNPQIYSLQHWYPRLWDEWARGKDGGAADFYNTGGQSIEITGENELKINIKPLLPEFVKRDWFYAEAICANEVDFHVYGANQHLAEVYPANYGTNLSWAISGFGAIENDWRVGRHGLVRMVKNNITMERSFPSSEAIFFAWLKDKGWDAELSAPGILAKQIFKRLEGQSGIFANKIVLGLIEHMNGGASTKTGEFGKLPRSGAARELSVGEIKSLLSGQQHHSGIYDVLLQRGVFHLGLRAQCPTCQRHTWFPLSTLGQTMECPKCLSSFSAAGNIDQTSGAWYYRTAGPFSVPNFAEGAYTVLLAISKLADGMFGYRKTTAVPSFTATSSDNKTIEADFAMFWKEAPFGDQTEGVLFGECKSFGEFAKKDIDRMRYLASVFPGSVLAFCTLRTDLSAKEVTAIGRLARAGRKSWKADRPMNPVLILTANELLTWQRPPQCWPPDVQKRFEFTSGLLSLCDATQQLYLNLPPIHEDREARRQRRQARIGSRNFKAKA